MMSSAVLSASPTLLRQRPALMTRVDALVRVDGRRWDLRLKDGSLIQLPAIGEDQHHLADALGVERHDVSADEAGSRAAASIEALVAQLPLAQRLRDTVIRREELPQIARIAMGDYMIPCAPRPVSQAELLALLEAAW